MNCRRVLAKLLVVIVTFASISAARQGPAAEAPSVKLPRAAKVFPKESVVFVSIPSVPALKKAFLESSAGRMLQDPQLTPFLSDFWSGLLQSGAELEEQVGLSIPTMLAIPQGELSFAVVASSTKSPSFLVMLEAAENVENLRKLLDRAQQAATSDGAIVTRESVGGLDIIQFRNADVPEDSNERVCFFVSESTLFAGNDPAVVKTMAERVGGEASGEVLADNPKFQRLLRECRQASQGTLHFVAFADPIQLIEGIAVAQPAAGFTLAVLPVLGLDGLNSLGMALSADVAAWDSISEFHVFLDNPRTGVLDAPALKKGDALPEVFVPGSVIRYTTLYIDVPTTLARVEKLFDGFRGQGAFQRAVARPIERNLGLSLTEEVLPLSGGRVSLVSWFEQPVRINSGASGLIFHVSDPAAASILMEKVAEKLGDRMERKSLGTREYYEIIRRRPEFLPPEARFTNPCVAILDNTVVLTDSATLLSEMFTTLDNPNQSLRETLEFKLTLGKVRQLAGSNEVTMMAYGRPEEGIRALYESARSEEGRQALQQAAEFSPPAKAFLEALQKHELPPFDVLAKYFAPQGTLLIDDGTGWHFVSFALRKKLP